MKGRYFIKIGIFLIVIGLVVSSYESVYGLVKNYFEDVNLSKDIVSSINVKYDTFNEDVNRYKTNLEDLYSSYDIYLDEFNETNPTIENNIAILNINLVEMLNTAKELKEYCSYDINSTAKQEKCEIFKTNLKSSIDSYHKAINEYNRIVSLYNKRVVTNRNALVNYYVSPIDKELNKIYEEL